MTIASFVALLSALFFDGALFHLFFFFVILGWTSLGLQEVLEEQHKIHVRDGQKHTNAVEQQMAHRTLPKKLNEELQDEIVDKAEEVSERNEKRGHLDEEFKNELSQKAKEYKEVPHGRANLTKEMKNELIDKAQTIHEKPTEEIIQRDENAKGFKQELIEKVNEMDVHDQEFKYQDQESKSQDQELRHRKYDNEKSFKQELKEKATEIDHERHTEHPNQINQHNTDSSKTHTKTLSQELKDKKVEIINS